MKPGSAGFFMGLKKYLQVCRMGKAQRTHQGVVPS